MINCCWILSPTDSKSLDHVIINLHIIHPCINITGNIIQLNFKCSKLQMKDKQQHSGVRSKPRRDVSLPLSTQLQAGEGDWPYAVWAGGAAWSVSSDPHWPYWETPALWTHPSVPPPPRQPSDCCPTPAPRSDRARMTPLVCGKNPNALNNSNIRVIN